MQTTTRVFPGGLVVKTLHFRCMGRVPPLVGEPACCLGRPKKKDYHPPPLPPDKPVQAPQPTHAVTPGNIWASLSLSFPICQTGTKHLPLEAMKKSPPSLLGFPNQR